MFATVGMILSLAGAALAAVALLRLRTHGCPICGSVGALDATIRPIQDLPGHRPTVTRSIRCRDCGARVEERRPSSRRTRPPRLAPLRRHITR